MAIPFLPARLCLLCGFFAISLAERARCGISFGNGRNAAGLAGVLCCQCAISRAAEPAPAEPTAQQLADAKEAYAKHGAAYEPVVNPQTKQTAHIFWMPKSTTDGDLKGIPDLPFRFGLYLDNSKITDTGVKELKDLKNLISLGSVILG